MARANAKVGVVVALSVISMLGLFGYYTYTGTVIHPTRDSANPTYIVIPQLRIDDLSASGSRVVTAQLTLLNAGNARVRLIDTIALAPLYDVKLRLQPADGGAAQSVPMKTSTAVIQRGFDADSDGISELIPGSALVRSIPLAALFDLQRDGKYELSITYQPEAITKNDSTLAGVHSQRLNCSAGFELLPRKTEAAPGATKTLPAQVEKAP